MGGKLAQRLVPGELRRTHGGTVQVELVGFYAHLLKIALIWSRGRPEGPGAAPAILEQMLTKDIPMTRKTICQQHKQV